MLKIYNTISHKKENFQPIHKNEVKMYVCGITAYEQCHIGHARTFSVFDMIVRYLKYLGYNIKYIRNITDIDDKIIKKSNNLKKNINIVTQESIFEMQKDFSALNFLSPDHEPRVTDHIKEIINLIKRLIEKKHAYQDINGDIMFSIASDIEYGRFFKKNFFDIRKLAVDQNSHLDFVLWKKAKIDEPSWDSPWGYGRPGWHIECSAMSIKYLGKYFDIHGGGCDLIFPHHENELSQSRCAYSSEYAKYWIHSGLITVNRKKMAKSINNFLTIRNILSKFDAETIRYFFISSHYRSQINYSENNLYNAQSALSTLYNTIRETDPCIMPVGGEEFELLFLKAMNDDFNTPEACAVLFKMSHTIHRLKIKNKRKAKQLAAKLCQLANILGLLKKNPDNFFQGKIQDDKKIATIKTLLNIRFHARQEKNWQKADMIREKLEQLGVILEDKIKKTIWKYK